MCRVCRVCMCASVCLRETERQRDRDRDSLSLSHFTHTHTHTVFALETSTWAVAWIEQVGAMLGKQSEVHLDVWVPFFLVNVVSCDLMFFKRPRGRVVLDLGRLGPPGVDWLAVCEPGKDLLDLGLVADK